MDLQALLGDFWVTKPDGTPDYAKMGSTEYFNTLPEEMRRAYSSAKAGAQFRDAQIAQDVRGVLGDKWINKSDGTPDYAAMSTPQFFETLSADQRKQYTAVGAGKKFSNMAAGYTAPLDPVGHAQVGSEQNWEWDVSKDMNDPQLAALARGDSADQAKLLELVGRERAHSLINQVMIQQGTGRAPGQSAYGSSSTSDPLTEGVSTLPDAVRKMYEENGILVGGKWAKTQDASGAWIANPAYSASSAAPGGGTTAPGTTTPPTTGTTTQPPYTTSTGEAPGVSSTTATAGAYTAPTGDYTMALSDLAKSKLAPTDAGNPMDFFDDEGYKFRLSEGQKAIDNTAAARGNVLSGSTIKAQTKYAGDTASEEYGKAYNRFTNQRDFNYGAANNDRNFQYGANTDARNFDNSNAQFKSQFDRSGAQWNAGFDWGVGKDARDFEYNAARDDRNFNYQSLSDLAKTGLSAIDSTGKTNLTGAGMIGNNNLTGAGATGAAGVGNANIATMTVSQFLQWLQEKSATGKPATSGAG